MDIFDFGTERSSGELEQALRDTLLRRSHDITAAAALPSSSERAVLLQKAPARKTDSAPGGRRVTLLAAAVVVLLCGASAVGVDALARRHSGGNSVPPAHSTVPAPRPTATPTTNGVASCPLPQGWRTAIEAGVIAVDQPLNQPVSAGPDGTFLMTQQAISGNDLSHDELAIFDTDGHGRTIWQAADPKHDYVSVSLDSAISANWVVYGLTRSQNLADHGVRAWNRQDGSTVDVRTLSAAEEAANLVIDFSPVVVGDTAYWVEHEFTDTGHETLVAQQLPSGSRSSQPVSHVSRLIAVGNGLVMLHDTQSSPGHVGGIPEMLTSGPGVTVPASVVQSGRMFVSDGSVLRWLSGTSVVSWRPGQSGITRTPARQAQADWTVMGPLIAGTSEGAGSSQVLDTRSGRLVSLPAGWTFALVTGGDLVVAIGNSKFGASTIRRVNVNSLTPASC